MHRKKSAPMNPSKWEKLSLLLPVFHLYSHTTTTLTQLQTPMCEFSPHHLLILLHELRVLKFNSILMLYTKR